MTVPIPPLPSLVITRSLPRTVDVLVVDFVEEGVRDVPEPVAREFENRYQVSVTEMATSLGASVKAGHRRTLPAAVSSPRIVVVGLGEDEDPTPEGLRQAAGAGVRHAAGLADGRPLSVAVSLGTSEPEQAQAVAEGALLGCYGYTPISSGPDPEPKIGSLTVLHPPRGSVAEIATAADQVARSVAAAREWVNIPANLLYPESFADQVRRQVADTKIAVDVLDEKALSRDGYGGLLAVGGGSSRPPRLVRLAYRPRGAKMHLALVGKGITFDSGGLNLKPAEGMYTMKCDMAGAAAVFAATDAIARLGIKVKVTAYGALAENLPSATAYRPSDVLTIYGGRTVENGNTDAEGRLVMADALARSSEDEPDVVVDVATLTGACIVALGERTAGLMSNDEELADQVLDAAETAGELFWQLPIPKEIRPKLDSKVADLRSVSAERWGGALVAAAFLREFAPVGVPWAHLDIAGPAFHNGKPYGYVVPGGTGFGVRTLIALAGSLAS